MRTALVRSLDRILGVSEGCELSRTDNTTCAWKGSPTAAWGRDKPEGRGQVSGCCRCAHRLTRQTVKQRDLGEGQRWEVGEKKRSRVAGS